MGDHLKKVQSGDPLVIPARAYNSFIDVARRFQGQAGAAGRPRRDRLPGGTNVTGRHLDPRKAMIVQARSG